MLDRVEYAMKSMQEVRRLIRNHGWAVLVAGSSGDLRATHVPCLLDPAHDPGGAGARLVVIGHTARADPVVSALRSGQEVLLVFQGPNGYISPAWYGQSPSLPTWNFTAVHVWGVPEVLQGEEGFSVLERTVEHVEAARGRPLGAARGRAGLRAADRPRDGSLSGPLSGDPGQGEAEPGQAAQDPGPRDHRAPSGRPVPERPARRRDATRPRASA